MPRPLLHLSPQQIDAVAASRPDPSLLDVLRAGQVSKRRLILLELRRKLRTIAPSDVDEMIDLLNRAAARSPAAVNEVITRPLVNAAAIRHLMALATPDAAANVAAALGFVGTLAVAAAARAGLAFEIVVPAPDGTLFLPGLGTAVGLGRGTAGVRGDGHALVVGGTDATVTPRTPGRWRPVRSVVVDEADPWELELDDQDPARDCFGYRPTGHLDDTDLAGWTEQLRAAWRIIVADYPDHAAFMRQSLRSLVPLASATEGGERAGNLLSASSQLAYGCVASGATDSAPELAMLLIHEVAHMTLSGALDLADLHLVTGVARHHAPWRMDPRPVGALLQGTYAHLGVTDFWRARRARELAGTAARAEAEFEFACWRELTTLAIRTLAGSGELTPLGVRLVEGMARRADAWWDDQVPAPVGAAARDAAEADTVRWRLLNQATAPDLVRRLDEARRTGTRCLAIDRPEVAPRPASPSRRLGLSAHIRATMTSGPAGADAAAGDRAFVVGDIAGAATAYRDHIARHPADDHAWAGLAVALGRLGTEPAASVLRHRPDLVQALYLRSRPDGDGPAPPSAVAATPDGIAAWLATGLTAGFA